MTKNIYSYLAYRDYQNSGSPYSALITNNAIDVALDRILKPHDVTHHFISGFLDELGINILGKTIPQASILNEIITIALTLITIPTYAKVRMDRITKKFNLDRIYSEDSLIYYERKCVELFTMKYLARTISDFKDLDYMIDEGRKIIYDQFSDLENQIITLQEIFDISIDLSKKIIHIEPQRINSWNEIANKHISWFNGKGNNKFSIAMTANKSSLYGKYAEYDKYSNSLNQKVQFISKYLI